MSSTYNLKDFGERGICREVLGIGYKEVKKGGKYKVMYKIDYTKKGILGKGGYGVVCRGHLASDPTKKFAIKDLNLGTNPSLIFLKLKAMKKGKEWKVVERMTEIDHPNLCRAHKIFTDQNYMTVFIVTELCDYDLCEYFKRRDCFKYDKITGKPHSELTYDEVRYIFQGIISGINALHREGILHRDIKPGNILLKSTEECMKTCKGKDCLNIRHKIIKITDFGISKMVKNANIGGQHTPILTGSPGYASPEQLGSEFQYDHRCDLWSAGIILYEMIYGDVPHNGKRYQMKDFMKKIRKLGIPYHDLSCTTKEKEFEEVAVKVCKRLLVYDWSQNKAEDKYRRRITMDKLLKEHEYVSEGPHFVRYVKNVYKRKDWSMKDGNLSYDLFFGRDRFTEEEEEKEEVEGEDDDDDSEEEEEEEDRDDREDWIRCKRLFVECQRALAIFSFGYHFRGTLYLEEKKKRRERLSSEVRFVDDDDDNVAKERFMMLVLSLRMFSEMMMKKKDEIPEKYMLWSAARFDEVEKIIKEEKEFSEIIKNNNNNHKNSGQVDIYGNIVMETIKERIVVSLRGVTDLSDEHEICMRIGRSTQDLDMAKVIFGYLESKFGNEKFDTSMIRGFFLKYINNVIKFVSPVHGDVKFS